MKYDCEQIKHIYEAFIKEHFDSINRVQNGRAFCDAAAIILGLVRAITLYCAR
ncbi:hypothetical protein SK92_04780 [Klebsiella oxytoca]|uniref:hypothetical protein n=1 Tax=Klebsiella oxytoca TaxID=571 RepID=UPI000659F7F6|nr:hypothetical protein [Klebsiella oxytoca]EKY0606787.1 hypothetical protein [Klebsiella oxytoca]KLY27262.1 hypothetical protein SK92_04780 [Klebsiella oxytoca]MCW9591686.1 hypothetical protein [Klebsiella oxytoca]MCW9603364.1 hypothetical protein [Klebsiella oxytoca]MCW9626036.1 hypothetical protein [Klebsiella oxytoca]